MWVVAYNPSTDERELCRRLAPNEKLDLDAFAAKVADNLGVELDKGEGYIPNCSGDLRVEFRQHRDNADVIWSGKSYFFKAE